MQVGLENEEMEDDLKGATTENDDEAAAQPEDTCNSPYLSGPSRMPAPTRCGSFSKKCKFIFGKMHQFFQAVGKSMASYIRGVFTLPLVRGVPISFCRPEDFNAAGEQIERGNQEEYEHTMNMIEAACNYSEKTKDIFEKIITDRKESVVNKKKHTKEMDWSKLAPWNESFFSHLESTFQVFDSSGDALVDFEEMSLMLTDYGDKTTPEDRRKVFSSADPAGKGTLTFNEFVTMFHNITVKSSDSYPITIVETFRSIDRNMARIRGLDVVQQLQAGLF